MSFRSAFVTLFAGGFLFAVGCVANDQVAAVDSGVGPDATTGGDSSTDSSTGNDAANGDAANDDAGIVTDGGGNPDPDGGVLIDSGADASATCGPPSGAAPGITSSCSSQLIFYLAGTVQPGSYDLAGFTVQGTAQYCSTFASAGYSGRLLITANGGKFTFDERIIRSNLINQQPNRSFDVTVVNKQLSVVQTCGLVVTPATWGYSTGTIATDAGTKNTIVYTRNSGTSTVRYRWVQQ